MRTALLVALLCSARATKPAAPFDVADEAAAAAGLECPGADVADVAARVEKLGANASTAPWSAPEAAVAASPRARAPPRRARQDAQDGVGHRAGKESGTLQALVARVALRLGLRPAAAAWPGKFWRKAMCPEALRRALGGRRADVALRHVFPIKDWWTTNRTTCKDRGPWVDGFFRLCRELMGNDVAFLLPLRGAGVRFPARASPLATSPLLAYYNRTRRWYAGDRDRWNPLAKDLRLLTSGDVESFVEAHLRARARRPASTPFARMRRAAPTPPEPLSGPIPAKEVHWSTPVRMPARARRRRRRAAAAAAATTTTTLLLLLLLLKVMEVIVVHLWPTAGDLDHALGDF
ncbi:hypothetical protein JL722_10116 [Aureococcus anophagefferens]|nr:hypothetical protein JL722_10116 [Aureococcus anophagefferens]